MVPLLDVHTKAPCPQDPPPCSGNILLALLPGLTGPPPETGQSVYPPVDCGPPTPWSLVLTDHGRPPHLQGINGFRENSKGCGKQSSVTKSLSAPQVPWHHSSPGDMRCRLGGEAGTHTQPWGLEGRRGLGRGQVLCSWISIILGVRG